MRGAALAAIAVVALAGCSVGSGGGAAACASPTATASPTEVAPGAELAVSVDGLIGDCLDTGQGGPNPPLRGAEVTLVYANESRSAVLATVSADADRHAEFTVTVPADAADGPATVWIGGYGFQVVTVRG